MFLYDGSFCAAHGIQLHAVWCSNSLRSKLPFLISGHGLGSRSGRWAQGWVTVGFALGTLLDRASVDAALICLLLSLRRELLKMTFQRHFLALCSRFCAVGNWCFCISHGHSDYVCFLGRELLLNMSSLQLLQQHNSTDTADFNTVGNFFTRSLKQQCTFWILNTSSARLIDTKMNTAFFLLIFDIAVACIVVFLLFWGILCSLCSVLFISCQCCGCYFW